MCIVLLPPGDNPNAVDKYIISKYHIIIIKTSKKYEQQNHTKSQVQAFSSPCVAFPMCIATNCSWAFVYWVIILECIFVASCVLFYCTVYTAVLHTLVAGLLATSQYPEGPATGHLDTGFSWFPCV